MGSMLSSIISRGVGSQSASRLAANHPSWASQCSKRFVPTEQDVLAVQQILTLRLPPELGNIILDKAGYWPHLVCSNESDPPLVVAALPVNNYNASCCYFVTPRLPENCLTGGSKLKVRRIVFHILSHDQGWASQGPPGTYEHSYTWFEAAIFRGLNEDDDNNPNETAAMVQRGSESSQEESSPFQVPNPHNGTKFWHLQTNVRASPNEALHEIVWDDPAPSTNSSQGEGETTEFSRTTGAGIGEGFIRELRSGDSIALFAKALFPGWANYVTGVDVQIFYSL